MLRDGMEAHRDSTAMGQIVLGEEVRLDPLVRGEKCL